MKSHASMNRIYRLVWNAALNLWVAVAENAKGRGKSGSARNKAALLMLVPLAGLMHQARAADAANAAVVSGAGTVATSGQITTINQATQKLAIDWTSLSTRANEALVFNQPNAQAIALNRITGSSPSELLGSLTANGQIFILNPNGVLFGAGSQVNVGGLVASTLNLSNADFEAGNYKFSGSGAGSVVNQGTLNAGQGGYLALLAPEVRNEGVMTASLGTALLAAGNKVTLNLDNGSLLGYSIDEGAIKALAENKQLIRADGGQVLLSAKAMNSLTTATVNNTGVIEARTLQNKAGRILLMGDMEHGTVNVGGTLDASAPTGGDGGFIETSAATVKVAEGTKVLALATNGTTGKWLVDPKDFTVAATGGDMTGATLSANLATADVELQSSGGGTAGKGDININDVVSWSANTLTLTAAHDVNVNAVMSATGSAGLALNTSKANGADTSIAGGKVNMALGAGGFTGRVDLAEGTSLSINGQAYTIINSLGAEGSTTGTDLQGMSLNGRYVLGSNIDASATATWNGGLGFQPIGPAYATLFTGAFDGLGHTVNGLFIDRPTQAYIGLFGAVQATVRNAGFTGGQITGGSAVGGVIGLATSSSISNLFSSNTVSSMNDPNGAGTGGLIGSTALTTVVSNSYTTGTVTGSGVAVGGLVGKNSATITDSYATGHISGNQWIGGLTGMNGGVIMRSYATGMVMGLREVGGLTGAQTGTISDSYSMNPSVGGNRNVGGLIGYAYGNSRTTNSYSAATYILVSNGVGGGLIGQMDAGSSATNVYSTTDVRGTNGAFGGLIGANIGTITNAYSSGMVLGPNAGGFAGGNSGTITGSYWNTDTSLQANGVYSGAGGATGLSAAGMKTSSSFAGWSIASTGASSAVWRIYEGQTAPLLRSFLTAKALADTAVIYNGAAQTGASFGAIGTASSGRNVGTYASGLYSNQQGYDFSGGSLSITPMAVTLAAISVSKTYDGTTGANTSAYVVGRSGLYGPDTLAGGTFTFDDRNAGAGKLVYTSGVTVNDGNGGANYTVTYGVSQAGTITQAGLTVQAADVTKTYDGGLGANSSVAVVSGTIFTGDVLDGGSFAFADKNAGTGKTVLTSGVTVNDGNGGGNYNITYAANTSSTITQASLAVMGVTAQDKVYDAGLAATLGGTAALAAALGSDVVTLSGTGAGLFVDKNAGNGKAVTVTGFTLTGADALNYAIVQPASVTANITKADLAVTGVIAQDKVYDTGTSVTLGGTASVAALGSDLLSLSGAGAGVFADKNAGTGKGVTVTGYTLAGVDALNYNLVQPTGVTANISQASLAVTGITAQSKVYDTSTSATLGGMATVMALGSDAVWVGGTGTGVFGDKNVGTGKGVTVTGYTLGGTDAANYAIVQPASVTATITQANLAVTGVTAQNKVYDTTTSAALGGTAVVTALGSDVLSVTGTGTGVFGDKNAGNGKGVTVNGYTLSGTDALNYNLVQPQGLSANISQASLAVTGVTAQNKVYDTTTSATLGGSAAVAALGSDVVNLNGIGAGVFGDKNAGTGKGVIVTGYTLTGTDALNYTLVQPAGVTANISQATLTVTGVTAQNKVYDTSTSATLGGTATVMAMGSDVVSVGGTGTGAFGDKNVGMGKGVTVTGYTLGGTDALNYTLLQPASVAANISQASLAVTGVTAQDKVYDTSTSATLGGTAAVAALGGDVVNLVGTGSGVFADKNAGSGKAVTVSGYTLSGTDAANYAIVQPTAVTANISQANLAVTGVTAQNKVYDGSTSATLGGTAGVSALGSDVVNVTGAGAGVFADKNAASGKGVTVTGFTLTGTDALNYTLAQPAGLAATITKADLTVTASGTNKVYDGSTAATVSYGDNRVAGDVLGISGSGSFADKNAGAGKAVNVGGISLSGADAGNYNLLNTTAGTTADINRASLAVVAGDATRMADGTAYTGGNGVSYVGLVGGDTAAALAGSLSYGGSSQGASTVGSYDITPGGLSANGNYKLRFVPGRLTLTPGGAESSALGGTELVGAYRGSLNTLGASGLLPSVSVDDGKGTGGGDGAATALNAAAADAAGE
ncbi:YDG domain-containing protein [Polaromonas sp. YR568]|uniref:YDG domain-containing protein n=1 Tax=Polaromonas sp. YR568 TaxID=1855301 RepID=UPI00398BDD79